MESCIKSKIPGIGGRGENIAAIYLQKRGYIILQRNYRTKFGEIDIIAKDQNETLIFIEVKTLTGSSSYSGNGNLDPVRDILPEDNLSTWKLHKLQRICQFFANAYPELAEKNGWQIDLIAIIINPANYKLKHYKDIS